LDGKSIELGPDGCGALPQRGLGALAVFQAFAQRRQPAAADRGRAALERVCDLPKLILVAPFGGPFQLIDKSARLVEVDPDDVRDHQAGAIFYLAGEGLEMLRIPYGKVAQFGGPHHIDHRARSARNVLGPAVTERSQLIADKRSNLFSPSDIAVPTA
jgi:hypothetical protein